MYVGVNVRRLRREAGFSAEDLARAAGISSVKIIEAASAARVASLECIARALSRKLDREVTVQGLMFEEPPAAALSEWRAWRDACAVARRNRKRRAG